MTQTYTLSSTDPNHYNRIRVTMPTNLTSKFVNVCVKTLTMNCNIEVLSDDDYIQFLIEGKLRELKLKKSSKLTAATLPYFLNELLKDQDIPIECEMTEWDTLVFVSSKIFVIYGMSYNAKQVCGFYYLREAEFPIESKRFTTKGKIEVPEKENVNVTDIYCDEFIDLRVDYRVRLDVELIPENAYGYRIHYELQGNWDKDEDAVCELEQFGDDAILTGLKEGEAKVKVTIKNANTLETSTPDFEHECQITVKKTQMPSEDHAITAMELNPQNMTLNVGDTELLIPMPVPDDVGLYHEEWSSDNPKVAVVDAEGLVQAVSAGIAHITYKYRYNTDADGHEGTKIASVTVNDDEEEVEKYRVEATAIGNMLSTPVFYLLANAGSPWFGNQTDNPRLMMSATVAMVINNSYTGQFPMVAEGDIVSTVYLNTVSDLILHLVDANMHELKLLNPIYCTVVIQPQYDQLNGVMY